MRYAHLHILIIIGISAMVNPSAAEQMRNIGREPSVVEGTAGHKRTNNAPKEKHKYRHPSIMVEEDLKTGHVNGKQVDDILTTLVVKRWRIVRDKYGRLCQYVSPEMTYAELKDSLNFHDDDVKTIPSQMTYGEIENLLRFHDDVIEDKERKPGIPHAYIRTDWLTCTITYLNKPYNGPDKSVKLKAVVIDNKRQAYAEAQAKYDREKGLLPRILDFFSLSPH